MSRPLLLGHRGARAVQSIPENTIASFDRALADGCDGFEFDVRLTADGQAVVCHDPKFEGAEIVQTAAEELPSLARLLEVLKRYRQAFLDIELKVSGLEQVVVDALRQQWPQRFVVSSFLPEVLENLHAADSTIPLGLICETKAEMERWKDLPVDYVMPHFKLASRAEIRRLKAAGKRVLVWTVNTSQAMRRFAEAAVDGIVSDKTSLLCETLKE